jgi:ATP-dependent RNA helicase DDX3X
LATSFYNDKDEPLAGELVKVLMESNQEVPDFLADKKPEEGEELKFDDDSEDEEDEGADAANGAAGAWGAGGGDAWGAGGDAVPEAASSAAAVPRPADEWNADAATAW